MPKLSVLTKKSGNEFTPIKAEVWAQLSQDMAALMRLFRHARRARQGK